MIHYAAIDNNGEVLTVEDNVDSAIDCAIDLEPDKTVQVQMLDEMDENPPRRGMAKGALRKTTLPVVSERDAMSLSVDQAHELLFPFFDGLQLRGKAVKKYNRAGGMIDAWLGQNYKTAKTHPEQKSKVMGLSLLPHHMVVNMSKQRKLYTQKFTARLKRQLPTLPSSFTLCAGSNQLCRDSCLVFAGQNASEVYNSYRKAMQTTALLNEPAAFLRILSSAIELHQCAAPAEGFVPYTRLNVLSDIPWEGVAPWLFTRFPRLSFYDYTKVAGRKTPGNYDITFSFSGTNENLALQEIDNGRRVAVVFLAHKEKRGEWQAW
jgi:hypothetical protein